MPADATLTIERVVAGGDGIAHDGDGRVVFVRGGLPGEVVETELTQVKRDFSKGVVRRVVEPAPTRVEAPCPELARGCGGCDWQHIAPAAQLELKTEIVRDALRRTARLPDALVESIGRVEPWEYRTSMRFALDGNGRASLRRARSNDVVSLSSCLVAHPAIVECLAGVRIPGAAEVSIRTSVATGDVTAWWTPEDAPATIPDGVARGGAATLIERVAGADLRVSASSFFQSGPQAAELLIDAVSRIARDALGAAGHVVDAYGGVGLFAATVVPSSARITVVEGSPFACQDATVNLRGRHAIVEHSPVERWRPTAADVVIADPSRDGLGHDAVRVLDETGAETLVLVSCDPVSLARDAALLRAKGFEHETSWVLDLFPHTHHVETVSRFTRTG